jgi:hypothetical protein
VLFFAGQAILAWKFHRAKALVKFPGSGFYDARDDSEFDGLPLVWQPGSRRAPRRSAPTTSLQSRTRHPELPCSYVPHPVSLEMDRQQGDIGRRDPAYSAGLAQRSGTDCGEFLSSFHPKSSDMRVIN